MQHRETPDGEFAEMTSAEYHMILGEFDKSLNVVNRLQYSDNLMVQFYANQILHLYYVGWLHPPISLEKANEYFEKAKAIYQNIDFRDDWERAYLGAFHKMSHWVTETKIERKFQLIKEHQEITLGMPEYGLEWRSYTDITFGNFYQQNGKFDLALQHFTRGLSMYGTTDTTVFYLNSLALLSTFLGRIEEAESYADKSMEVSKTSDTIFLHRLAVSMKAYVSELKQKYDEAENLRRKTLEFAENDGIEYAIFRETYNLFLFYLRMYNISREEYYLNRAIEYRDTLTKLSEKSSDDPTIERLAKLANGFILKMGGIRDKAKAIDIFEAILTHYPSGMDRFYQITNRSIELKMHLVELYFEDLSSEIIGNTKEKIDGLMMDIKQSPLLKSPQNLTEYSSYQTLVAKYMFYVDGNVVKALDILDSLRSLAESYNLERVTETISREIRILESEISKWSDVDLSIKERIEQSKIKSYVQDALKLVKSGSI